MVYNNIDRVPSHLYTFVVLYFMPQSIIYLKYITLLSLLSVSPLLHLLVITVGMQVFEPVGSARINSKIICIHLRMIVVL